jgi:hypothetical protein
MGAGRLIRMAVQVIVSFHFLLDPLLPIQYLHLAGIF